MLPGAKLRFLHGWVVSYWALKSAIMGYKAQDSRIFVSTILQQQRNTDHGCNLFSSSAKPYVYVAEPPTRGHVATHS